MSIAYGVAEDASQPRAKRISYLIDPQGVIQRVYPEVKPAEHIAEVLNDLG